VCSASRCRAAVATVCRSWSYGRARCRPHSGNWPGQVRENGPVTPQLTAQRTVVVPRLHRLRSAPRRSTSVRGRPGPLPGHGDLRRRRRSGRARRAGRGGAAGRGRRQSVARIGRVSCASGLDAILARRTGPRPEIVAGPDCRDRAGYLRGRRDPQRGGRRAGVAGHAGRARHRTPRSPWPTRSR